MAKKDGVSVNEHLKEAAEREAAQRKFKQTDKTMDVTAGCSRRIKNEKDLVEYLEVDTDVWEVDTWECGRWEVAMKIKTRTGDKPGDFVENPFLQDLWTIRAKFKRRVVYERILEDVAYLKKAMAKHSPKYAKIKYKKIRAKDKHLLLVSLFDHHLGKLVWGREGLGQPYDTEIAKKLFMEALYDILQKTSCYEISRILFPVGNDFYNVDNFDNETTAGTRQDQDTRWTKMYQEGRQLLIKAIDVLRTIAPVDVVVIPGNHDELAAWCVGDALQCWYRLDKDVHVDLEPHPTKYYAYGQTMFGLTHGKDIRPERLPGVMTSEQSEMWGQCYFKEGLVGHLHHKKDTIFMPTREIEGVRIRQMPSMVSSDAYHVKHGYVGALRAAEGHVYHVDDGYTGGASFNPRRLQAHNAPILRRKS